MIRFIEDLGIIPNRDKSFENDPSLKQGQKMMEYERTYSFFNMNRIRKLETDTYPSKKDNIKTIVETMESIESASHPNSAVIANNDTFSKNEQKFYKALNEYSNTSKLLEREMIERNEDDHSLLNQSLETQYNSLISISSCIERELGIFQKCSDKGLSDDFERRKNDLALHISKLKNSCGRRKPRGCNGSPCGCNGSPCDCNGNKRNYILITIIISIIVLIFIYQILYGTNDHYLYIIFLIILVIVSILNNM